MRYVLPFVLALICIVPPEAIGQSLRDSAIDFYRMGNYERAIAILEKLDGDKIADYPSLSYLGAAYIKTNRNVKASEVFNRLDKAAPLQSPFKYEKNRELVNHPQSSCSGFTPGISFAKVAVELGSDARIGFIFAYAVSQDGFKSRAEDAAKAIQFKPAIVSGKPVSTILFVEYNC